MRHILPLLGSLLATTALAAPPATLPFEPLWQVPVRRDPTQAEIRVHAGDRAVLALQDPRTGAEVTEAFAVATGASLWRRPGRWQAATEAVVLFIEETQLVAVDRESGQVRWTRPAPARVGIFAKALFVFTDAAGGGSLTRVDPATGKSQWSISATQRDGFDFEHCSADTMVRRHGGDMIAHDAATGAVRWRRPAAPQGSSGQKDEALWAVERVGELYRLQARDCRTGKPLVHFDRARPWGWLATRQAADPWLLYVKEGDPGAVAVTLDPASRRLKVPPGGALVHLDPRTGALRGWKPGGFGAEGSPLQLAIDQAVSAVGENGQPLLTEGPVAVAVVGNSLVGFRKTSAPAARRVQIKGRLAPGPCLPTCKNVVVRIGPLRTQTDTACRFSLQGSLPALARVSVSERALVKEGVAACSSERVPLPGILARRPGPMTPLALSVVELLDPANFGE